VACGYRQVPGLHFNDSIAPVVNDMTFIILLLFIFVRNFKAKIIEIKNVFVNGLEGENLHGDP
jgi:hypothetical protein